MPRVASTADWVADWFTESPSSTSVSVPFDETKTTTSTIDSVTQDENEIMIKNNFDEISTVDVQNEVLATDGRSGRRPDVDSPDRVISENLWERTEVLAGKETLFSTSFAFFFTQINVLSIVHLAFEIKVIIINGTIFVFFCNFKFAKSNFRTSQPKHMTIVH